MGLKDTRFATVRRGEAVQTTECMGAIGRARNVIAGRVSGKVSIKSRKLVNAGVSNDAELLDDLFLVKMSC